MVKNFTELMFTESVLKFQEQGGSLTGYRRMAEREHGTVLSDREVSFISERDSFYISSVSKTGWPYVQFRGGPRGFLKTIDEKTLGFANFVGNKQYITTGNALDDGRAALILMDYINRRRLKVWAEIEFKEIEDDPALSKQFVDPNYKANIDRLCILKVAAFDWNCPQHIPQRFTAEEMLAAFGIARDDMHAAMKLLPDALQDALVKAKSGSK